SQHSPSLFIRQSSIVNRQTSGKLVLARIGEYGGKRSAYHLEALVQIGHIGAQMLDIASVGSALVDIQQIIQHFRIDQMNLHIPPLPQPVHRFAEPLLDLRQLLAQRPLNPPEAQLSQHGKVRELLLDPFGSQTQHIVNKIPKLVQHGKNSDKAV